MKRIRKHPPFKTKKAHTHSPLVFPNNFLWGTATSSHQVEGWNDHNDWWLWEQEPGTIVDGQVSGRAADHYNLYKQDIQIIEKLNQNSYRFSLEWSRIMPEPDVFNEREIKHYISVLEELKKHNIKTMVTLFHFTLPIWFSQMGGFEKKKNIKYFLNYIKTITRRVEHLVDFWITINEPNVYTLMSYGLGLWPPGKTSVLDAYKVFDNLAYAHKEAYEIIRENENFKKIPIGFSGNIGSYYSYDKYSFSQWMTIKMVNYTWNHWFLEKTQYHNDFVGVNYYTHQRIRDIRLRNLAQSFTIIPNEDREMTDMDWEIYPPGIFEALIEMNKHGLPIYVTENGISTINDHRRARYIVSYLKELYHAIKAGVDVRGYFYWSLLDNFEWDKGFLPRFGLVEVDYKTLKRKIRPSAKLYAQICRKNAIDHDLLKFTGHGIGPEEVINEK